MRMLWATVALMGMGSLPVQGQETPANPPSAAPAPVVLENNGKPMSPAFRCTEDDLQSAGLSCTEEEPCAVFLELSAVTSTGNRILAAGNIHTESVTLYSILLASEDGGRTWMEPIARIRGAALDHIQFFDGETGWITGQELSPLPQNPFLLVTSDGGKTWRQRPVLSDAAENRFGTVQQFYFSAKDSGTLIVDRGPGSDGDRYVLYESPDGGENWQIKQESTKALTIKRPAPSPADWRVRVDGPSKSFHIERHQGDRWVSIGAFHVRLDPCKPAPPAEAAAPNEEPKPPIPPKVTVIKK
jgi:hypothetical protein